MDFRVVYAHILFVKLSEVQQKHDQILSSYHVLTIIHNSCEVNPIISQVTTQSEPTPNSYLKLNMATPETYFSTFHL